MEKSNYECYNCRRFQRYFIKKKAQFVRTKFGYCIERGENVSVHGKCDCFKFKEMGFSYDNSIRCKLDGLLTESSTLRTILEEEAREHEESKKV